MNAERRAIEARLPPAWRGRAGYGRLLESVPLRVSVSGIRGKSGLTRMVDAALRARGLDTYAKETGTDPVSYKGGVAHPIRRDPRRKAVIEETMWEVKRFSPMQALVLENQAITPYTMRVFNEAYCRAQHVLVTNLRRDHLGDIARTLPAQARAFGRSVPAGAALISGERDRRLAGILRRSAEDVGARFVDAAPRDADRLPGFELVTVLDALLRRSLGAGLTAGERVKHAAKLHLRFQWAASRLPGVRWFHGAEINDVDSTQAVLGFLQRRDPVPVHFVAYFRRDRRDRTASFVPFLRQALQAGTAAHAYVAGAGSDTVAQRLRGLPVTVVPDRLDAVPGLLRTLAARATGQAVMTIANAVPPWPRAVATGLQGAEAPAWTPAEAGTLPSSFLPGDAGPLRAPPPAALRAARMA